MNNLDRIYNQIGRISKSLNDARCLYFNCDNLFIGLIYKAIMEKLEALLSIAIDELLEEEKRCEKRFINNLKTSFENKFKVTIERVEEYQNKLGQCIICDTIFTGAYRVYRSMDGEEIRLCENCYEVVEGNHK